MKKFKTLVSRCSYLSECISTCTICVNRRNGYIAIDEYDSFNQFVGPMFIGNFHECDVYTQALLDAYYRKMF